MIDFVALALSMNAKINFIVTFESQQFVLKCFNLLFIILFG